MSSAPTPPVPPATPGTTTGASHPSPGTAATGTPAMPRQSRIVPSPPVAPPPPGGRTVRPLRPGPAPVRGAPARKGPPGRRDPGRPDTRRPAAGTGRPTASALRAAARRERERRPPYWFAGRLLLVLSGQCPVHHMLGHTRDAAYEQLTALAAGAPLRPPRAGGSAPQLLDAHGTTPRDGVIEAFARIATGPRQRAMAFRLEYGSRRRWLCAAVELDGLTGSPAPR